MPWRRWYLSSIARWLLSKTLSAFVNTNSVRDTASGRVAKTSFFIGLNLLKCKLILNVSPWGRIIHYGCYSVYLCGISRRTEGAARTDFMFMSRRNRRKRRNLFLMEECLIMSCRILQTSLQSSSVQIQTFIPLWRIKPSLEDCSIRFNHFFYFFSFREAGL